MVHFSWRSDLPAHGGSASIPCVFHQSCTHVVQLWVMMTWALRNWLERCRYYLSLRNDWVGRCTRIWVQPSSCMGDISCDRQSRSDLSTGMWIWSGCDLCYNLLNCSVDTWIHTSSNILQPPQPIFGSISRLIISSLCLYRGFMSPLAVEEVLSSSANVGRWI